MNTIKKLYSDAQAKSEFKNTDIFEDFVNILEEEHYSEEEINEIFKNPFADN